MFIVLEGPDFVGKTTQVALLAEKLRVNSDVLQLAFPSSGLFGVAVRECLDSLGLELEEHSVQAVVTQACMLADRYAAVPGIRAHLRRGGVVLADRWTLSGTIYGAVDGLAPDLIDSAQAELPQPDMLFVLHAPLEVLLARAQGRPGHDRYENAAFLKKIVEVYDQLRHNTSGPYRVHVKADHPPEQIAQAILGHVAAFLRKRGF
jgi:dTMP kinase